METIIDCEKHLIRLVCFCAGFLSQGVHFFVQMPKMTHKARVEAKHNTWSKERGGQKRWWETWLQDTVGRWLATAERLRACSTNGIVSSLLLCSTAACCPFWPVGALCWHCSAAWKRAHNAIFTRRPPLCWARQLAAAVVLPFTVPVCQVSCCVMKSTVLSWEASNCTERQ